MEEKGSRKQYDLSTPFRVRNLEIGIRNLEHGKRSLELGK
jgi:hypothetical protein